MQWGNTIRYFAHSKGKHVMELKQMARQRGTSTKRGHRRSYSVRHKWEKERRKKMKAYSSTLRSERAVLNFYLHINIIL